MPFKSILPGLYSLTRGGVNVFLIDVADGLTLIDTGLPNSSDAIVAGLRSLGKQPQDIRQILVTHGHRDHAGSLAAIQRMTGAPVGMHALDAAVVEAGLPQRPLARAPGLLNAILFPMVGLFNGAVEPAPVARKIQDGEELVIAGGMRAIHIPGHSAGQLALLWAQHGGVLFVADAVSNMIGLGWSVANEDFTLTQRSVRNLAALDFEVACFGHGNAIVGGAAQQFRRKWPPSLQQPQPS